MFVQEFADILRRDNTIVKIARSCLAWRLESVKGGSQAYCNLTSVPFPAQNRHLLLFFCKSTDTIFIENLPYFLDLGSSLKCIVIISHQSQGRSFWMYKRRKHWRFSRNGQPGLPIQTGASPADAGGMQSVCGEEQQGGPKKLENCLVLNWDLLHVRF